MPITNQAAVQRDMQVEREKRDVRSSAIPDFSSYENDPRYKVIPLTQSTSTVIDAKDWPLVSAYKWYAHWDAHTQSFYSTTCTPTDQANKYTTIAMHQLLTGFKITDHVDGNTLLNVRSNLRDGSNQNQRNRKMQVNNCSGYCGVFWHKRNEKWQSEITIDGKRKYLGYFTDILDAALAYDMTAREFHGSFATLNFPLIGERSSLTGEIRYADPELYPEYQFNGGNHV